MHIGSRMKRFFMVLAPFTWYLVTLCNLVLSLRCKTLTRVICFNGWILTISIFLWGYKGDTKYILALVSLLGFVMGFLSYTTIPSLSLGWNISQFITQVGGSCAPFAQFLAQICVGILEFAHESVDLIDLQDHFLFSSFIFLFSSLLLLKNPTNLFSLWSEI